MSQQTYIARKGQDADFAALTVDSLTVNTATVDAGAIVLADGETVTLGTGSDVTVQWDATNLLIAAAADDSVIEVGDSAATQKSFDVKIYGNSANGADYMLFDASANTLTLLGIKGVFGVNDTGVDVQMFGATSGKSWLWDESADSVVLVGDQDVTGDTQLTGTLTVGVDDTGHDVQLFGATSGASLLWDESEDQLVVTGPADVPAIKIGGAGSKSTAAFAAAGTAWADSGTPAFIADQMYLRLNVGGTVYRIPLWADA